MDPCIILLFEKQLKGGGRERGVACELQGDDSVHIGPRILHIRDSAAIDWATKNPDIESGVTTFFSTDAYISNDTLNLPHDMFSIRNYSLGKVVKATSNRFLKMSSIEIRSVLVVRVQAPDYYDTVSFQSCPDNSTGLTEMDLSDAVFGNGKDTLTLSSQFSDCSANKLNFIKTSDRNGNSTSISNGVVTVNVFNTSDVDEMENAVSFELASQFNVSSPSELADHVMYCMPQEIDDSVRGYIGSWLTVFGSQIYCTYISDQMHQIGANLGLYTAAEGGDNYGDESGYMGTGYCYENFPRMCFNGAHHWQLGWFSKEHETINPLHLSGSDVSKIRLIGSAEYTPSLHVNQKVVLRVQGGGDRYFVAFNRKLGNNNETQEGGDQVMITARPDFRHTELKASLSEGGKFIAMNFGGRSNDVTILVEKIDLNSTPAIAYIEISSTACKFAGDCDDLDQCTDDRCTRRTCVHENICSSLSPSMSPCKYDEDCDDGNQFTIDFCIEGSCVHKDNDAYIQPRNPKRGIGFSIAHGCDVLNNHDAVSWWYSWKPTSGFYRGYCDDPAAADAYARNNVGIEFVPMFNPGIPPQPFDAVIEDNLQQARYLMAINEPERDDQADVTPLDAAKMWPEIVSIAKKYELQIVAPCTTVANSAKAWYRDWLADCTTLYGQPCEYDFTCFHSYLYPWPCTAELPWDYACLQNEGQQILDSIDYWYRKFGKPIWITEFACNAGLPCDEKTNLELMKQMLPILDASNKVFRYAWFSTNKTPSNTNQRVWETTRRQTCLENEWLSNNMTDVGSCYRAATQNPNCYIPYAVSFQKASKKCYCSKNACEETITSYLSLHRQDISKDSSELKPLGELYQMITFTQEPLPSPSPPSPPSPPSSSILALAKRGSGCDGLDNNEDGKIDECAEDMHIPELFIPVSIFDYVIPNTYQVVGRSFSNNEEAMAFIKDNVRSVDDCAPSSKSFTEIFHKDGSTCEEAEFKVIPYERRCPGTGYEVGDTVTFYAKIDGDAPKLTCGFFSHNGTVSPHISIRETTYSNYVDSNFWYDIQENCKGVVDVNVEVRSNEVQIERSAHIFTIVDVGKVMRPRVFVTPSSCQQAQNTANLPQICEKDKKTNLRLYNVVVSVTDVAGNTVKEECTVTILPNLLWLQLYGNSESPANSNLENLADIEYSSQRVILVSAHLQWDQTLDSSFEFESSATPSTIPSTGPTEYPSRISMRPSATPYTQPSSKPTKGNYAKSTKKEGKKETKDKSGWRKK